MHVTVIKKGKPWKGDALKSRYYFKSDSLPGQTFGPFFYEGTRHECLVFADMAPVQARALIFEAYEKGTATFNTDTGEMVTEDKEGE